MRRPDAHGGTGVRGRTTWIFLSAVLLHGLAYLVFLPPWMGEDEPWQYEYVHHIAEGNMPQFGRGIDLTAEDIERMPLSQLQVMRRFPGLPPEEIVELQARVMGSMERTGFWRRVDWAEPVSRPHQFDQHPLYLVLFLAM